MLNAAQLHQALLKLLPIRDEQYAERDDLFEKMVVEERLSSKEGSVCVMNIVPAMCRSTRRCSSLALQRGRVRVGQVSFFSSLCVLSRKAGSPLSNLYR